MKVKSGSNVCIPVQDLKVLGYKKGKPVGLIGVTELSEDQKKQIIEQQEVGHNGNSAVSLLKLVGLHHYKNFKKNT